MALCLTLGGITTEMAIEDLTQTIEELVTSLLLQGVSTQDILRGIESVAGHTEEELKLLNARTEEAYDTKLDKKDII